MSTETHPLKLMPHTKRVGSGGHLLIEPGDRSEFELPNEFRSLFEVIDAGGSLSKLPDHVDPTFANQRFRLIKKFLIFLDEHDMLADRDYMRLAESLNTEYSWPTSLMSTELAEFPLAAASRRRRGQTIAAALFVVTLAIAFASVFAAYKAQPLDNDPSLIKSLALFLLTFSFARSVQALWTWLIGAGAGEAPQVDLVIELAAVRVREEQRGRAVGSITLASNAVSYFACFGVAAFLTRFADAPLEFSSVMLAGVVAFFTETNPYARSALTDLLRSLYANLEKRSSRAREQTIRRFHIGACVVWVLLLGLFLAVAGSDSIQQLWSYSRVAAGPQKIAGFALLAINALFVLGWFADLIGSVSYDETTAGQIRKLWRRKKMSPLQNLAGLPPTAQDLERLPFLRQIPAEIRKNLIQAAQVRAFKEGQAVCHQGDKDRNLFIVLEGRLAVAKTQNSSGGQSRRKVVAWLEPGAVFGENSFFFGQPRSADVVAMDPGRVLVIPHSTSMKFIDDEKSGELRLRIWFLQALMQSEFFRELPSESLDSILHSGVEQRFPAGAKVIQEGEAADACYFMVQGRASVTQKTKAIGKINAGDAFGEISILFPGTLRTATIIADTDLMTIRIDREKFWKLLRAHLPLALEIERVGLRRLKKDRERT